jgi:dTDP-4-amino-4,6-dideoxygalactose transaminase
MFKKSRIYINLTLSNLFKLVFFSFYPTKKLEGTKFNLELNKYLCCKYSVDFSHCRNAFHTVLTVLKNGNKKEVLISPYALYPMINAIYLSGCKPIFVDFENDAIELSLNKIVKKININTLAVVLTNYSEENSQIEYITKFLKKKNIFLIEDCAIQFLNKKKISDIQLYSFNFAKNISSVVGGVAATNNYKIYSLLLNKTNEYQEIKKTFLFKKIFLVLILKFLTSKYVYNFFFFYLIKYSYKKKIEIFFKFYRPDHLVSKNYNNSELFFYKMNKFQKLLITQELKKVTIKQKLRKEKFLSFKNILQNKKILKYYNYQSAFLDIAILLQSKKEKNKLFYYLLDLGIECRFYVYQNLSKYKFYSNKNYNNSQSIEDRILLIPCNDRYTINDMIMISKYINIFFNSKYYN